MYALTAVGTKPTITGMGRGRGFGPTVGAGSTDRVLTSAIARAEQTFVVVGVRTGNGGNGFGRYFQSGVTGVDPCEVFYDSGGGVTVFQRFSNNIAQFVWADPGANVPFCTVVSYSALAAGWTPLVVTNGKRNSVTTTVAATGAASAVQGTISVGNREGGGDRHWNGHWLLFAEIGRAASEAECISLSLNPWQLFAPRRIFVPVTAAGGGVALTSSAGLATTVGAAALTTQAALAGAGASAAAGLAALSVGSAGATLASSAGALQASAVASLTTRAALAAAGPAVASASGTATLTTQAALSGAGAAGGTGLAVLSVGGAGTNLASASGAAGAVGVATLTTRAALAGAGAAGAAGAADLSTGTSGAVLVSSAGASPAAGSASLTTRAALAATLAIAQASASAALTVRAALAGSGLVVWRGVGVFSPDGAALDVFTTDSRTRVGAGALTADRARIGGSALAADSRDSVITTTAARRIGGRSL